MKPKNYACRSASLGLLLGTFSFLGCETVDNNPHTVERAAIGAAVGGILGGVIGHQSGEATKGAALGAGVGAVVGGVSGRQRDQEFERRQMEEMARQDTRLQEQERREKEQTSQRIAAGAHTQMAVQTPRSPGATGGSSGRVTQAAEPEASSQPETLEARIREANRKLEELQAEIARLEREQAHADELAKKERELRQAEERLDALEDETE